MKEWILSVFTIVFIFSILNMILPEGRLNRYIKHSFSILIILVIIKPIVSIKTDFLNFNDFILGKETAYQVSYLDFINEKKIDEYVNQCYKILESFEIYEVKVEIEYESRENAVSIKKVYLNFTNAVIKSDKEHIDIIENVKTTISKYLVISNEDVVIYE